MTVTDPQKAYEFPRKPLGDHEVHIWTLQLYIMLSSGVPLLAALESMARSNMPRVAPVAAALAKKLGEGHRLSEAMKVFDPVFSGFLVNLVVVGESTGRLAQVLERGSLRAARRDKMEREIKGALAYPLFLAIVSIAMAVFMGFYMFPKLLPFLTGLGVGLPWPTRALIWCTDNLSSFILVSTILGIFGTHLLTSSTDRRVKRLRGWLLYNSPIIGEINGNRAYADCMNDLGLLLEAGLDLTSSLKALHTESVEYQERIDSCIQEICSGTEFSEAVEISGLFPRRFMLQVKSGEETGNLAKVFRQASEFLDEGISMKVTQLVQLMEPAILVTMGFITGFIVLATFMPLYSMASGSL